MNPRFSYVSLQNKFINETDRIQKQQTKGYRKMCGTAKRIQAAIVALCMGSLILGGCRSLNTTNESEPVKITMVHYISKGTAREMLENSAREFNESQDEIQVNLHYIPSEDYQKEIALQIADGNVPDMALLDCADFAYFNDMHPFVDLEKEIPEIGNFMEEAMKPCTIDGRVKGFHLWMNCSVLYYNKKALLEAGVSVPQTPEEFTKAAEALTTDQRYGVSFSVLREEAISYCFLSFLWAKGVGVDCLDTEGAKEVYDIFLQLVLDDALSEQSINMSGDDAAHQFGIGNAAMMLNSSSYIETLQKRYTDLEFDVTYLPTGGEAYSVIGGEVLGVSEGEHQEAALEFARFMADKERIQKEIDKTGLFAPQQDVFEKQYPGDEVEAHAKEIFEHATAREYTIEWPRISHVLISTLRETISGQQDTEEILIQAAEEIREIREEAR